MHNNSLKVIYVKRITLRHTKNDDHTRAMQIVCLIRDAIHPQLHWTDEQIQLGTLFNGQQRRLWIHTHSTQIYRYYLLNLKCCGWRVCGVGGQ